MRPVLAVLFALESLSLFAAAHPFVIVNTRVTEIRVPSPAPTHFHGRRQDLLSSLASAADSFFGISDDDEPTSTSSVKQKTSSSSSNSVRTLLPPAVASTSASPKPPQPTSTSDDDDNDDDGDSSTSTDDSTSTDSSSDSSTSMSDTTVVPTLTATTTTSMTVAPAPSATLGSSQPTSTPEPSKASEGGVPGGGVAVAVIMSIIIVGLAAWLIFRSHPKTKAWWAAREAKMFQERSYREALDGPNAGSPNLRQQALGSSRRQTLLKSFFAPATAKLGGGQEIRRKPVNWGAQSVNTPQLSDNEKVPMAASAAPMGKIDRNSLKVVHELPGSPAIAHVVSPMSLRPRESFDQLPPVSPMSSHRELPPISAITTERDLPALPPVPPIPRLIHAKKGSDGVFRLS